MRSLFKRWYYRITGKSVWEYGKLNNGVKARRNKLTGKVQLLLWKAGEQGHTEDCYHKVGHGWENTFELTEEE